MPEKSQGVSEIATKRLLYALESEGEILKLASRPFVVVPGGGVIVNTNASFALNPPDLLVDTMPETICHAIGTTCVFPVMPGMLAHEMLPVGGGGAPAPATVMLVDPVPFAPLTV